MDRPDLLLLLVIGALLLLVIVLGVVTVFFPSIAKRHFIQQLLSTPVIAENLKGSQVDVANSLDILVQRAEERQSPKGLSAVLEKINDITWDVSGLIGVIVTVVLMTLVVTQKYESIPREIFAGWTTILGFYFGKEVGR